MQGKKKFLFNIFFENCVKNLKLSNDRLSTECVVRLVIKFCKQAYNQRISYKFSQVFLGKFEGKNIVIKELVWYSMKRKSLNQIGTFVGEVAEQILSKYRLANCALRVKGTKKTLHQRGEREPFPKAALQIIQGE